MKQGELTYRILKRLPAFVVGFFLVVFAQRAMSQTIDTIDCDCYWPKEGEVLLGVPEYMPSFPGGEMALMDYILEHLVYPQEAKDAGVEGRVFIGFVVMEDGSLGCFKVFRGLGYGCDEAAMDVVRKMPKWKPGAQRGKPVQVPFVIPVNFKLEDKMVQVKDNKPVSALNEGVLVAEYVSPMTDVVEDPENEVYQIVEQMPQFPGGVSLMMEYVREHTVYPEEAKRKGIQGRVYVSFVVETDGSISNAKVLRGIGNGCDEEAVRVVESMPKWSPGVHKGETVRVSYQIPLLFMLEDTQE